MSEIRARQFSTTRLHAEDTFGHFSAIIIISKQPLPCVVSTTNVLRAQSPRAIYKCFIEKKTSTPVKSQGKWLSEDDIRNSEINLENQIVSFTFAQLKQN